MESLNSIAITSLEKNVFLNFRIEGNKHLDKSVWNLIRGLIWKKYIYIYLLFEDRSEIFLW